MLLVCKNNKKMLYHLGPRQYLSILKRAMLICDT